MRIDDDRVKFYLTHRDQLEEWFELRREAATAIDDWLTGLRADIASLGNELGSDVDFVSALDEQAWPSMYLKRSSWPGHAYIDATALIGLQWRRGNTLLADESSAPYVGVRIGKTNSAASTLREDAEFKAERRRRKDSAESSWPAYVCVLPLPDQPFPDRADEYRKLLIESLRDVWTSYASIIDATVRGTAVSR